MLTLEEAIQHAQEKGQGEGACSQDHRQLASWLQELEQFRKLFKGCDREEIEEALEEDEALTADGFEDALVGFARQFNSGPLALYNLEVCIEILVERDGMTYGEAVEYLEFNTLGAWVGGKTPVFATLIQPDPISP